MGGERTSLPHKLRGVTDPTTEQGLEAATSCTSRERHTPGNGRVNPEAIDREVNGKGATAAVTRCGCRRGVSFEGYEPRCGDHRTDRSRLGDQPESERAMRETQRTPGSVAGCNKPATPDRRALTRRLANERRHERRKPSRW